MKTPTTATSKASPIRVPDDYLRMIKRFPLRPIRSKTEMDLAGTVLDQMLGREDLTEGQSDYLAGLIRFVRDYEQQSIEDELAKLGPIQLLKHLMTENQMSTSDLGAVLGSRGLASEVLNRKRGLSKTLIAKVAKHFRVAPGLFLKSTGDE